MNVHWIWDIVWMLNVRTQMGVSIVIVMLAIRKILMTNWDVLVSYSLIYNYIFQSTGRIWILTLTDICFYKRADLWVYTRWSISDQYQNQNFLINLLKFIFFAFRGISSSTFFKCYCFCWKTLSLRNLVHSNSKEQSFKHWSNRSRKF